MTEPTCPRCGISVHDQDVVCPNCSQPLPQAEAGTSEGWEPSSTGGPGAWRPRAAPPAPGPTGDAAGSSAPIPGPASWRDPHAAAGVGGPQQPEFAPPPGADPAKPFTPTAVADAPATPIAELHQISGGGPRLVKVAMWTLVLGGALTAAVVVGAHLVHRTPKPNPSSGLAHNGAVTRPGGSKASSPSTTLRPLAVTIPRLPIVDPSGIGWSMVEQPSITHRQFSAPDGQLMPLTEFRDSHGSWAEVVGIANAPSAASLEAGIAAVGADMGCQVGPAVNVPIHGVPGIRTTVDGCLQNLSGVMGVFEVNGYGIEAIFVTAPGAAPPGESLAALLQTIHTP